MDTNAQTGRTIPKLENRSGKETWPKSPCATPPHPTKLHPTQLAAKGDRRNKSPKEAKTATKPMRKIKGKKERRTLPPMLVDTWKETGETGAGNNLFDTITLSKIWPYDSEALFCSQFFYPIFFDSTTLSLDLEYRTFVRAPRRALKTPVNCFGNYNSIFVLPCP